MILSGRFQGFVFVLICAEWAWAVFRQVCAFFFCKNHVQWIASVPSDLPSSSRDILMMIKRKQAASQISWDSLSEGCVNWVFMGSWSKTDVKEMDLIYFLHFIMRCELSKRRQCAFCFFYEYICSLWTHSLLLILILARTVAGGDKIHSNCKQFIKVVYLIYFIWLFKYSTT